MTATQPVTVVEVERKYAVPEGFRLPDLTLLPDVAMVITGTDLALDATYFDTVDLALARCGMTLRRRSGGHDAGWHLKTPGFGARVETQLPITDTHGIPAYLLAMSVDVHHGAPLQPVARIRTRRRETLVVADDGTGLAIVADDAVIGQRLLPPQRREQWREVEVELTEGTPELLDAIEGSLFLLGALLADATSKLAHALGLVSPTTGSPAGRAVQEHLCRQREQLRCSEPLARAGDADGVHSMRVAARRIRAIVRTYGPLLNTPDVATIDGELRWLANVLGTARDLDVLRAKVLGDIAAGTPDLVGSLVERLIEGRLTSEATAARADLAATLASDRYRRVLAMLDPITAQGAPDISVTDVYRRAHRYLTRGDRRIARAMAAGGHGDTAMHAARKAFKQARYAIEALVPLNNDALPLIDSLTDLQNALGDQHDAVVAANLLQELAGEARGDRFTVSAYERLWRRQEAAAAIYRQAAVDQYHAVQRNQLRAWLDCA